MTASMVEIIECAQGSQEWHLARAGVVTGSMFHVARQRLKTGPNKGGYTEAAKTYAFRLAIERISGEPLNEGYETWQMTRGHRLEPEARLTHERRIGMLIERAGFVRTTDGLFGASADGLIEDDGGSEYKCLVAPDRIRDVIVDHNLTEFIDQVQGCLWLTGRRWWHHCLYCPSLTPAKRELVIHEFERDEAYIEELEQDLVEFNREVERCRSAILESDTSSLKYPLPNPADLPAPVPASAHGIFGGL